MKTAVVTGGAGFIGSHLCRRLLSDGYRVVCVDDLSTGSESNIDGLAGDNFSFLSHDVRKPIMVGWPVDEIYNLACPASPVHYQADPIKTTTTCVLGALNVLELAHRDGNNAKVLQASTSEVYGDPAEHPQTEEYWGNVNPIGPRSCYDEGKRCAESLFFDHNRQRGTRIKVARIFNTYGPRMARDDGRVVSEFICAALEGRPLMVNGTGLQTRSFCYVDDMVEGLVRLMATEESVIGPVNLGNPIELTMVELAGTIFTKANVGGNLSFRKKAVDDPSRRRPDITKARDLMNWWPRVTLDDGIANTVAYFRK